MKIICMELEGLVFLKGKVLMTLPCWEKDLGLLGSRNRADAGKDPIWPESLTGVMRGGKLVPPCWPEERGG